LTKIRDVVVELILEDFEEFVIPLEAARLRFCDSFRRRVQFAFDQSPLTDLKSRKRTAEGLTLLGFHNSRYGLDTARTSEPTDETSRSAASTDREVSTSFVVSYCPIGTLDADEPVCCLIRKCVSISSTFDDFTDCLASDDSCSNDDGGLDGPLPPL
jgi:hypothetical protein